MGLKFLQRSDLYSVKNNRMWKFLRGTEGSETLEKLGFQGNAHGVLMAELGEDSGMGRGCGFCPSTQ
jgi:hypothetical protein